jgi:hypothetical protein
MAKPKIRTRRQKQPRLFRLVAIPQALFAERAVDAARNRIADPHDEAEQKDGEDELKTGDHESNSVIFFYL